MRKNIPADDLRSACTEPGPGDGQDPRYDLPELPNRVPNRKALQLCGQVARTLAAVLAHECADEVLRALHVETVIPAPNTSRLLVSVSLEATSDEASLARARLHLERARGLLRGEVAAAVHRRRIPDLVFQVVRRGDDR